MSYLSTHLYETVYILKPTISDADATTIHNKVDSVIKKFNGELSFRDEWGLKDLAYQIGDNRTGKFCIVNYSGDSSVVGEIERHFKILGDVIRYLTVSLEADYDYEKLKKQMAVAEEERKRASKERSVRRDRY